MPHKREILDTAIITASLGGLGGLVHYIDQVRKGQRFRIWLAIINIVISAWLGWLIQPIIPDAVGDNMRYSLASVSGFLSYPILTLIETKGLDFILNKFKK